MVSNARARKKTRGSALCCRRDPTGFLALKGTKKERERRNNNTNNKDELIFFLITTPRSFVARFPVVREARRQGSRKGEEERDFN